MFEKSLFYCIFAKNIYCMKKTLYILFLEVVIIFSMTSYAQTTSFPPKKYKVENNYIDFNKNGRMDPYEDKTLSTTERVNDLLNRMSFLDKQGQLLMDLGWQYYERNNSSVTLTDYAHENIKQKRIGSLWGFYRADPWSGKDFSSGLTPKFSAKAINQLQRFAIDSTDLGIPIFVAEECMHGVMQVGSISYPTGLGLASSWNSDLIEQVAGEISKFALKEGINIAFGPLVDIAKDPRWSRCEETYGEDTYLVSQMGMAFTKGLRNVRLENNRNILPTLKHFAAYGASEGGHNGGSVNLGRRMLRSEFLPPFYYSIKSGAQLIMTSYNEIDGIPCTMNPYLLKDILRNDWHFDGIVISDLHSISGLCSHGVAANLKDAAIRAFNAGVDLDLSATDYYNNLYDVESNLLNESVRRILTKKFECGLFDNPFIEEFNYVENDSLALKIANESIVLMNNSSNILPLDSTNKMKIFIGGPNADNVYNLLGDYTGPNDYNTVITPRAALEKLAKRNRNLEILYSKGCGIKDTSEVSFADAKTKMMQSDVIVLCLGGSSSRYQTIEYQNTGAAKINSETISDITSGEGFDRSSLHLAGVQEKFFSMAKSLNKPIILILVNGRPLVVKDIIEQSDATLECFYPGKMGGEAIIETIFGKNNPSGRLPMSFPRSEGALPCYYNAKRVANRAPYLEDSALAAYVFGYGNSYTKFAYSDFSFSLQNNGTEKVNGILRCNVSNVGSCDGSEVVQVYLKKKTSLYATSEINLRGFAKKAISIGKTESFEIEIDNESFREWDAEGENFILSPGEYEISVRKDAYTPIWTDTFTIF